VDTPPVTVVLLFTDIVDSTRLQRELGNAAYGHLLDQHNQYFIAAFKSTSGGELLKHTGDGFYVLFGAPSEAVACALRFQRNMKTAEWSPVAITSRIGLHVGEVELVPDPVSGRRDARGFAASIAARVMSLATGGQVLMTRGVFENAQQALRGFAPMAGISAEVKRTLQFEAHGRYLLKGSAFEGTDEPTEVFEIGETDIAPLVAPPDSEKAKRYLNPDEELTLGWRPAAGVEIPGRPGWKLEKRLGMGGFGEAWLARHQRTRELRVFKFCFDAERLRTFRREEKLFMLLKAALGERDDIARIFDTHLDEAPFYLESEFSPLGSLDAWADAHPGGLVVVPLVERLRLFARVTRAVAAAHSVAIIHKDLKPANLLIFPEGENGVSPRIADFGIGHLADTSRLAAFKLSKAGFSGPVEDDLGTRLYAAPEYNAGKPASVQGDIYALGVILYQIVTADLNRPLGPGWERDISDDLLREDIAQAVDVHPERRFASAAEFADRIEKLENRRRDIEADREVKRQLAAAKARGVRRKRILAVTIVALAVLGALAAVLAVGLWREARQRAVAVGAERQAHDEREKSNRLRLRADNLINFMLSDTRELLRQQGRLDLLEKTATEADGYFREVETLDPASRFTFGRAKAWEAVAEVEENKGNFDAQVAAAQQRLKVLKQLNEKSKEAPTLELEYADALQAVAYLTCRSDPDEAASLAQKADSICRLILKAKPQDFRVAIALARVLSVMNILENDKVAQFVERAGKMRAAMVVLTDAEKADLQTLLDQADKGRQRRNAFVSEAIDLLLPFTQNGNLPAADVALIQRRLALCYFDQAKALLGGGDFPRAITELEVARKTAVDAFLSDPQNLEALQLQIWCDGQLSETMRKSGNRDEMLKTSNRRLKTAQDLVGRDPKNPNWWLELSDAEIDIALHPRVTLPVAYSDGPPSQEQVDGARDAWKHFLAGVDAADHLVAFNSGSARWQQMQNLAWVMAAHRAPEIGLALGEAGLLEASADVYAKGARFGYFRVLRNPETTFRGERDSIVSNALSAAETMEKLGQLSGAEEFYQLCLTASALRPDKPLSHYEERRADAATGLARIAKMRGDDVLAVKWLETAIQFPLATRACEQLAIHYEKGLGCRQDLKRAADLKAESAQGGKRTAKMLKIPVSIDGKKVPVQFYIVNPGFGAQDELKQLELQLEYLREVRGILVDDEVRGALRKLWDIVEVTRKEHPEIGFKDVLTYVFNYNPDGTLRRSTLSEALDNVKEARKACSKALNDNSRTDLAAKLASAAFTAIFDKKFPEAQDWSEEALSLTRQLTPSYDSARRAELVAVITTNLAHAFLFRNEFDKALAMYREHWADRIKERTFGDTVREDFAAFEKAGLQHPDMTRIQDALGR
jgi:class 3 adenylate cyclase/serine/threonine protein kinase